MDSSQLRDRFRSWSLSALLDYEQTLLARLQEPNIDPVWKDITENALTKCREIIAEKKAQL